MTRLRTTQAARADIRGIETFSKAAFGSRAAREYLAGLSGIFDLLEARPLAGVEDHVFENMRSFRYRSHRIYYRLEGDILLVVRILHHARDVAGAFKANQ